MSLQLRVSTDQQEKLFDQFRTTQDGPTQEQIMLQLYQIMQQEASQMQFMRDISRSMCGQHQPPQGVFYQPMPAAQYMVQQPLFPHPHQGGCRRSRGSCRGVRLLPQ